MDWFETLTGFRETSYRETQANFEVVGDRLISRVNGRSWVVGRFGMVSLADLREQAAPARSGQGRPRVRLVQGDVRALHANPAYQGALFQVASQFNALEMSDPDVTPEDGVTRYVFDRTQGPACALAAAPATIYRNYFAPVGEGFGQTRTRQLDGLSEVGAALSALLAHSVSDLWTMCNGYALCTPQGLESISRWLDQAESRDADALRARLQIGLHRDVEVTVPGAPADVRVSQAFASALPVAYASARSAPWAAFATLVLEAAYEATLLAGALNAERAGSSIVLLTLLGGGVFGNNRDWIFSAIRRAVEQARGFDLDIRLVSHGEPDAELIGFVDSL